MSTLPSLLQRRSSIVLLWYTTIIVSLLVVLCISSIMIKDVGTTIPFTWHPILMTISFLFCMTQGIHSYLVGFGSNGNMGNNGIENDNDNHDNDRSNHNKNRSRMYHGILMLVALITAFGGYIAIYIAHSNGKGHTAVGDTFIKQFHTWFGYLILVGILFQSLVGLSKYILLYKQSRSFAKFHGLLGPLLWLFGCFNIFLGVWFWSSSSNNLFLQIVLSLSIISIVVVTILFFNIRSRSSNDNINGNESVVLVSAQTSSEII